ncbi:MAG: hypothetical protein IJ766_06225 [Clostridia bacterium]|nr:hypothetical protein [Clostridia bacterium]
MKINKKRMISLLLCIAMIFSFAVSAAAQTEPSGTDVPLPFDLGVPSDTEFPADVRFNEEIGVNFPRWTGSGDVTVSFKDSHFDTDLSLAVFKGITGSGVTPQSADYTVQEIDGCAAITLKESFLKTLADGNYYFYAQFDTHNAGDTLSIPLKLDIVTGTVGIEDAGFDFLRYPGSGDAVVYLRYDFYGFTFTPDLFLSLKYKGAVVDPANYTVSGTRNLMTLVLKADYVQSLTPGVHYFDADFSHVKGIWLRLRTDTPLPGDLDLDGKVTSRDARLALRASARLETLSDTQILAGDLNRNGAVNAADARNLLRASARLDSLHLSVAMKTGETFAIESLSCGAGGSFWMYTVTPSGGLTVAETAVDKLPRELVGSAAEQTFTVSALQPGVYTVSLQHNAAWQAQPMDTLIYTFTVE